MRNFVYMAVTADRYEFPIEFFNTLDEIAKYGGYKNKSGVSWAIKRRSINRNLNCRFVKVNLDKGVETVGMSVSNQCNPMEYFSLSTIRKYAMEKAGLNMTVSELRKQARTAPHRFEVLTGDSSGGQVRKTKVYKYSDFKQEGDNGNKT